MTILKRGLAGIRRTIVNPTRRFPCLFIFVVAGSRLLGAFDRPMDGRVTAFLRQNAQNRHIFQQFLFRRSLADRAKCPLHTIQYCPKKPLTTFSGRKSNDSSAIALFKESTEPKNGGFDSPNRRKSCARSK